MVRLFICALLFASCSGAPSKKGNSETDTIQIEEEIESLTFYDIIPANISDSSKAKLIGEIIQEIRLDTTLVRTEFTDSTGTPLNAYYRNDTLVKIVRGMSPGPEFDDFPMWGFNYTSCYFLLDSLIGLNDNCSSIQQTGRCNPVNTHSSFYFYGDNVVYQKHEDNIGSYAFCGCDGYSMEAALRDKKYFAGEILDTIGLIRKGSLE